MSVLLYELQYQTFERAEERRIMAGQVLPLEPLGLDTLLDHVDPALEAAYALLRATEDTIVWTQVVEWIPLEGTARRKRREWRFTYERVSIVCIAKTFGDDGAQLSVKEWAPDALLARAHQGANL